MKMKIHAVESVGYKNTQGFRPKEHNYAAPKPKNTHTIDFDAHLKRALLKYTAD